ncbi:hypothetical protein BBJ29_008840 [Phytophthora kernoviae]|uniref:Glycoside hydrolase n=1 Tax=Phytophthora kernoviae TaxID=325452 RepID=A0A3F2RCQ8_9STRA|nr:hypothetical protein BBJ29_008840 [Phytophthora kernoviae]RLN53171.1 hypothetical protein BBP00_00009389 [Phytophthora kernoviae]
MAALFLLALADRSENGDYAQTAEDIVDACPEDSRLSIVVYGLPNKDCDAKESAVGSTVQSASDYVNFLSTLTTAIGTRKVLYILEPDAIGLLASDTTDCGESADYLANLQTAIILLSVNENAEIYLDVGYWTLEYTSTASTVAGIVKRLASAGSKVKGITLNTSNYQATSSLATLCSNFQSAVGSTDLHCIFDTSRNYKGAPESDEWCNVKSAGIGALPTSSTGLSNVDYFVWAKPPGDSDGTCSGRTSDSIQGPGAGVFFDELFQTQWNQGMLVAEMGFDSIDGIIRSYSSSASAADSSASSSTTQSLTDQEQQQEMGQEAATYNSTSPLSSSSAASRTDSPSTVSGTDHTTQQSSGTQTSYHSTQTAISDSTPTPTPATKSSDTNQITTESSESSTVGTGTIVVIAVVAATVVALAAIMGARHRQKKMLNEAKTPTQPPNPAAMTNFRAQLIIAPDSSVL